MPIDRRSREPNTIGPARHHGWQWEWDCDWDWDWEWKWEWEEWVLSTDMKWMNECVCVSASTSTHHGPYILIKIDDVDTNFERGATKRWLYDQLTIVTLLFSCLLSPASASSSFSSSPLWLCGSEEFPCTRNWLNDFRKWFGYPKHISSESITLLYGPRSVDETRLERLQVEVIDFEWVGFGHDINIIIKVSINDTLAICLPSPPLPASCHTLAANWGASLDNIRRKQHGAGF